MDQSFYSNWFQGFEKGLEGLSEESRSCLLRPCAKNCADSGVLGMYQKLYESVNGDRDAFYTGFSKLGGARGEVVVSGKEYYVYFPKCFCDLHATAGVNTPLLCECSRQSIMYVGKCIWGDVPCKVELIETVLGGANECKFKITFL